LLFISVFYYIFDENIQFCKKIEMSGGRTGQLFGRNLPAGAK